MTSGRGSRSHAGEGPLLASAPACPQGSEQREENIISTHWGFVCRSHDPEIESDRWFNRGAALLAEVYQKQRAGEWPDAPDGSAPMVVQAPEGTYSSRAPIYWLRQHPQCDVALRSEYGDTREIASAEKE